MNLRKRIRKSTKTELQFPESGWRNKKPPVLTSGCFVCRVTDLNCGPFNFQSNALPTELTRQRTEILTGTGETVKVLVLDKKR